MFQERKNGQILISGNGKNDYGAFKIQGSGE